MKMRLFWTAIALCTAVVISGSNAEAQKYRHPVVNFEGCLYYRTNTVPPCLIVRDYALFGVTPSRTPTIRPWGVYVRGYGRPIADMGLCGGATPLRVLKIEAPGGLCLWPMR